MNKLVTTLEATSVLCPANKYLTNEPLTERCFAVFLWKAMLRRIAGVRHAPDEDYADWIGDSDILARQRLDQST